ncbi:hypothetical protein OS493_006686 [Desmophyllum pertusum]|uniref:Uncharacterized protein n=1 Tax=Desmophyllum pertusum TaxID=174260 RepID=A0A9W9ZTC3_9CNID|nr:hypothetical protein OS493_006686 [Desmophyllum pertusum]
MSTAAGTKMANVGISWPQAEYIGSGAGYFTSKFSLSEESITYVTPGVIESIKSIPVKAGKAFTIAEYGCADGGTSMPLMYACVKELKNLNGKELEVHINYEDMPENDYNSLFYFSQGLLPGPSSYLTDFPNVFVSATGTNFYDQCFPSGSVNFGFSCMAAQWLSRKPCNLTKALLHKFSEVLDEKNEFSRQAETDWERFLLMRARELSEGGKLVLVMFLDREDCKHCYSLYNGLYKVLEGMAKDNIITEMR